MRRTARMTDLLRNRGRALVFAGAAAALAGAGAVGVSTAAFASAAPHPASASAAAATRAGLFDLSEPGSKPATPQLPAPAKTATASTAAAKQAAPSKPSAARVRAATRNMSWTAVRATVAHESNPAGSQQGMAEQLRPVAASGPQAYMPMTPARMANATTIVKQDLAEKMGLRSAVIAVATSMQESTLQNLHYGTSDSLGLFQQRPSCGWGTAAQITDPAYAARAFLTALHTYQANNPDWASQPLWQSAQGVQASGYPTAYAKWEAQAANIVQHVTTHLV